MQENNVFIISRRSWQEDDFEYGTFEPIFITLKDYLARKTFRELLQMALTSAEHFEVTDDSFEYQKDHWFYQYKLEGFVRDRLCVKKKE